MRKNSNISGSLSLIDTKSQEVAGGLISTPPPAVARKTSLTTPLPSGLQPGKYASVLKLFVSNVAPYFYAPWKLNHQQSCTGSGFAVKFRETNYVITNAHVAEYCTDVTVRKPSSPTKFQAKLLCLSQELDLAILSVDSEKFWSGLDPLPLRVDIPELDDNVTVVGYPRGDDALCVTRGVVSRITMSQTNNAMCSICQIQIDAAINSGNSGGPVFDHSNHVVGVARATLVESQNCGFIVATTHLLNFMSDYVDHGRFLGVPSLGIQYQKLENSDLRRWLKIPDDVEHGIMLKNIAGLGSAHECEPNDVLLSVDGINIGQDGTVPLAPDRSRERVDFSRTISFKRVGEVVEIVYLRNGEVQTQKIKLKPKRMYVRTEYKVDHDQEYYIFGGFVFAVCSRELIYEYFDWHKDNYALLQKIPFRILHQMLDDADHEPIVVSELLKHPVNHGYSNMYCSYVMKVNETEPRNLLHLIKLLHQKEECVIELYPKISIVLNREKALAANPEILKTYQIASESSFSKESYLNQDVKKQQDEEENVLAADDDKKESEPPPEEVDDSSKPLAGAPLPGESDPDLQKKMELPDEPASTSGFE